MFDEQENQIQQNNEPEVQERNNQVESDKEINFRLLREKMEKIQRERDEAINYIKNIEAKAVSNLSVNNNDDEDFNLDPDALAEGKHISKVTKRIKDLEQQLKNFKQQSEESLIEAKLKARYNDFDKIVSQENIESLRQSHPEIWATINTTPDLYNKAISAYTLIKELKIARDETYDPYKQVVQKNLSKPRPVTSVNVQQGDSPLSRANAFEQGLSEELKAQLHREMVDAMRNR